MCLKYGMFEAAADPFFTRVVQALRSNERPPGAWLGMVLLLVLIGVSSAGVMGAVALLVALALRDLARFTVMKLTDTYDSRLLVVPLVHGELPIGTTPGREAAIIMSGPAFLVGLSLVSYLVAQFTGPGVVLELSRSAVWLAAFTLLPLKPYDGWRMLNLALFSRSEKLEMAVGVLTSLALAALGAAMQAWFLVIFSVLNVAGSASVLRLGRAAKALLAQGGLDASVATGELPEPQLKALFNEVMSQFASLAARQEPQLRQCVALMREVHLRVTRVPPSLGVTVVLLAVYGALITYFVIGVVVFVALNAPPT